MRTVALVACLVLIAAPAAAQHATPAVELSGGYSSLDVDDTNWPTLAGWVASGSVTITRWLGIEVDAGRNAHSGGGQRSFGDIRRWFAGAGPRFVARGQRASGFAHVLVGAERLGSAAHPTVQAGGGIDVWLTKALGARLGIDKRLSWDEEDRQGSWRFQIGAVVALGSR